LDESDLLHTPRFSVRWIRGHLHRPLVLLTLILVLATTTIGVWVWPPKYPMLVGRSGAAVVDQSKGLANLSPTVVVSTENRVTAIEPKEVTSDLPEQRDTLPEQRDTAKTDRDLQIQESPPAVVLPYEPLNNRNTEGDDAGDSGQAAKPSPPDPQPLQIVDVDHAMLPWSEVETDLHLELLMEQMRALAEPKSKIDPEPETPAEEPETPAEEPETPAEDGDDHQLLAVPDEQSVAETRRQLEVLVPQLTRQRSLLTADVILSALQEARESAQPGTVEDWTFRLAISEYLWLTADVQRVREQLKPLVGTFAVTLEDLLVATFIELPKSLDAAQDHAVVMENGLQLADQLLVHEDHVGCRRVLNALDESVAVLNDASYASYLRQLEDAVVVSARLHKLADETIGQPIADATSSRAGITGRYHCLMLRQWDLGLPWLSKGNDRRLASLAADELAIEKDAAVDVRLEVAQRWLAAADRNDGREADSMRLHAIDLLQHDGFSQRGLRQLEAERLIEKTRDSLPVFLRNSNASDETEFPKMISAAVPVAERERAGDDQRPVPGHLGGRVLSDATDLGIRLEYQTSLAIGGGLLQEIAEKLDRDTSIWTIELAGEFEIQAVREIRIRIAESTGDMSQEIWLDDQQISFAAQELTKTVSVSPGRHAVRWVVTTTGIESLILAVQDAETGQPIEIQPMDAVSEDDTPAQLTIKIVASKP
jgi:hypothetical protein